MESYPAQMGGGKGEEQPQPLLDVTAVTAFQNRYCTTPNPLLYYTKTVTVLYLTGSTTLLSLTLTH
jgi:hypothetical protein